MAHDISVRERGQFLTLHLTGHNVNCKRDAMSRTDPYLFDELIADWELAASGEKPYKIDPL